MKTIFMIGVLFFIFIGISSNSIHVFGHANPVLYNPPSNSVFQLDQLLPNNITILYSERPEPKISYIHVLNTNNERIDSNDFKIIGQDERAASVTLDPTKLSSGTYTISWLVLSKDDGHITKGSYVFSITDPLSTSNTVTLKNEMGKPIDNVKNVIMQFNNQEQNIGPIIANLKKVENGIYNTTGPYLSQDGEWNIKITVQRTGEYDLNHSFDIFVPTK